MSGQKRQNHYTSEFKESAVKLAIEGDQSTSKTVEELWSEQGTVKLTLTATVKT
jgi:transposase-like protein